MGATNTRTFEHDGVTRHPALRHALDSMLLEERTRWAMQIHDGLTQSVTSIVLELQTLRQRMETDPGDAIETIKVIEDAIRADLQQIRELLFDMTTEGPAFARPALEALVRDQMERWHMPASVEVEGELEVASEEVLETAYAIVVESLTNAAKHSGAAEAHVRIHLDGAALRVQIEDRGIGVVAATDGDLHFGFQMMRARAETVGGSLQVESRPGHGTTVVAVLPVGGRGDNG